MAVFVRHNVRRRGIGRFLAVTVAEVEIGAVPPGVRTAGVARMDIRAGKCPLIIKTVPLENLFYPGLSQAEIVPGGNRRPIRRAPLTGSLLLPVDQAFVVDTP